MPKQEWCLIIRGNPVTVEFSIPYKPESFDDNQSPNLTSLNAYQVFLIGFYESKNVSIESQTETSLPRWKKSNQKIWCHKFRHTRKKRKGRRQRPRSVLIKMDREKKVLQKSTLAKKWGAIISAKKNDLHSNVLHRICISQKSGVSYINFRCGQWWWLSW